MNDDVYGALNELHSKRHTAAAALAYAAAALTRGRCIADGHAKCLHALQAEYEAALNSEAARMAGRIADGYTLTTAERIENALGAKLAAATHEAAMAAKAIAVLESTHATAQTELQAVEQAVVQAVDRIFCAEDVEAAQVVAHHLTEAAQLGKALLHLAIANELNGHHPPPEVDDVLTRLDLPLIDRRIVAINLMKYGDILGAAERTARRIALIAGESEPVNEPAAA